MSHVDFDMTVSEQELDRRFTMFDDIKQYFEQAKRKECQTILDQQKQRLQAQEERDRKQKQILKFEEPRENMLPSTITQHTSTTLGTKDEAETTTSSTESLTKAPTTITATKRSLDDFVVQPPSLAPPKTIMTASDAAAILKQRRQEAEQQKKLEEEKEVSLKYSLSFHRFERI